MKPTVDDFAKGERVQLHPATDAWMRGDRYGTIERIGTFYVWVRMDRSGKLRKCSPDNLLLAGENV